MNSDPDQNRVCAPNTPNQAEDGPAVTLSTPTKAAIETLIEAPIETSTPTVFFNSECPICNAEICHYERLSQAADIRDISSTSGTAKANNGGDIGDGGNTFTPTAIRFQPIADNPDILREYGLSRADIERRLYGLDANGRLISGIDAFIMIWGTVPRYRWLAHTMALPPFRYIGALIYDHIAVPFLGSLNARRKRKAMKSL
ncbi:thiol-disulfide oxidoreductase DCC family protein [Kordiimonas sp. SCSIO 12610]|uniref:thiol-disulfide oxidoreductase DCC family protein n=1 Tax=Kordiimonas sp. SCSIO 12610 TaxID=2829597 RepID=UPI00210CCFEC|nr:DUF393 domain-containing protein [Kordiimonas sp. SCSIO 12610]UTW56137.1 DUF393 domain-containing protein [Kordiimonas sp. SCSIO 12610]